MDDCIFCKIIAGEIPSKKVYEDEKMLAFHDINPSAPVHLLCIPKIHIDSLNEVNHKNIEWVSHIIKIIPEIAKSQKIDKGYRIASNIGENGGQSVNHLHFHIFGGKKLGYMC